jgi:FMN phosphatase YigB (HAD superfamily)
MSEKKEYRLNGRIIEGVTLDFWATLAYDDTYEQRKKLRREQSYQYFTNLGYKVDYDQMVIAMDQFSKEWMKNWLEKQKTPGALDAVEFLISEFGYELNEDQKNELAELIDDAMVTYPPAPIEGMVEAVNKLAEVFPLALICDTGLSGSKNVTRLIENWGLADVIKVRVFSDQVGVSKPNKKMFFTALEGINVPQHRVVHIGDMDPTDIKGAKDLGMAAIRFDGGKDKTQCAKCSMADRIVHKWTEVTDLLLEGKE